MRNFGFQKWKHLHICQMLRVVTSFKYKHFNPPAAVLVPAGRGLPLG